VLVTSQYFELFDELGFPWDALSSFKARKKEQISFTLSEKVQ
jgi:hypothetical protein